MIEADRYFLFDTHRVIRRRTFQGISLFQIWIHDEGETPYWKFIEPEDWYRQPALSHPVEARAYSPLSELFSTSAGTDLAT